MAFFRIKGKKELGGLIKASFIIHVNVVCDFFTLHNIFEFPIKVFKEIVKSVITGKNKSCLKICVVNLTKELSC